MLNFIPNEMKLNSPRDPHWITKHLKTLLRKNNRLYKNYKRHGYKADDKIIKTIDFTRTTKDMVIKLTIKL